MTVSNATNASNPKEMFEGRTAYKEEFSKSDIQFDTGYTNRLFGKVDTLGNVVQINEGYLTFFGNKDDKSLVSKQKRKLNYVANVYIVSDPANRDNEGKVFLFKFGKKIFDKITEAMNPQFEDEQAINPFDLWEGANFKLKIRKVDGYQNYDKSEFESPAPLKSDDEELEKIWKSEHSLAELIGEKEFKSYDKLKERLNTVLGLTSTGEPAKKTTVETLKEQAKATPKPKTVADEVPFEPDVTEDDDMAYFSKLAEED